MPVAFRVGNLTFDCDNAAKVAAFWSAVLGRPVDEGSSEFFASIGRADGERHEPAWFFEKVPEPKQAKNRLHLDLVNPAATALDELVRLGATIVGEHSLGESQSWTVLQDPEGNEFCVAAKSFTGCD
jgi:predicted enzyme related to lactoylglutathione lyase